MFIINLKPYKHYKGTATFRAVCLCGERYFRKRFKDKRRWGVRKRFEPPHLKKVTARTNTFGVYRLRLLGLI